MARRSSRKFPLRKAGLRRPESALLWNSNSVIYRRNETPEAINAPKKLSALPNLHVTACLKAGAQKAQPLQKLLP